MRADTHLAYAVSFHAAEGRTVDAGISVFTGTEDRQAVNVGMTRGRDRNDAYVITGYNLSDAAPGTQAAPELGRYARLEAEREGRATPGRSPASQQAADAEAILAQCLTRDGRETSALEYQAKAWSDADRLDVLAVQWQDITRGADTQRYTQAVRAALPQHEADELLADPAAATLWRTLREAETAGITPADALTRAVARGPLDTAASVAKVIDWRVRQHTGSITAQPARPWAEQVPQTGDPDTDQYAAELATAMDDRTRRLGEHAAGHLPAWAQQLGPVPEHPLDRADWEHKAAAVAAYREMWGHAHPRDPIGARPGQHSPEARAMWQAAADALGYTPGDLRGKTDGNLWARRRGYAQEMAWQPEYAADKVAAARAAGQRAALDASRAQLNAQAASDPAARERLEHAASVHAEFVKACQWAEQHYTRQQEAYEAWDQATRTTREYGIAADAELRRRHPDTLIPLLTPHSQPPATQPASTTTAAAPQEQVTITGEHVWVQLGLDSTLHLPDPEPREAPAPADAVPVQPEPGEPGPDAGQAWVQEALEGFPSTEPDNPVTAPAAPDPAAASREAAERAADILSMSIPAEDPDAEPEPAWEDRPWRKLADPGYEQPAVPATGGHPADAYIRHEPDYPVRTAADLAALGQPQASDPDAEAAGPEPA
jgi:hypothetical protein